MSQKIIRIGSSAGATLSKSVLASVGLKIGDLVDVKAGYNQIIITPASYEEDRHTLKKIDSLLKRHLAELEKINEL